MRKTYLTALAAIFVASAAAPALADWDRIGSVAITRGVDQTAYTRFGGSVEALNLTARDEDVFCRSVTATFANGQTRSVFNGRLDRGRDRTVDLPGRERLIRRIDFDCRPDRGRMATVDIAAEIGNYRDEWRRSPDWANLWARQFAWAADRGDDRFDGRPDFRGPGPGPRGDRDWVRLGVESFEGRGDREGAFTGFRGQNLDTIGLRPLNNDARCTRVTATFRNGGTRELNVPNFLPQDRITRIDLPGRDRDVMRVNLSCRAAGGRQVRIEILGQG